ncbi:MAG: hypothetical protein DRJ10_01910 [Bacteroidetes bacterium]|nr:MAG: hypothetical protein DRI74_08900 [Bacteroidota bacterium]RLD84164.1 MAG: hypothetical protein DRJ10_01910 [Bacteroidota bacterium]
MRNITANAILNLKEQPQSLYVHGSIMVYRMDDTIKISKVSPQGINPSILVLDLEIVNGSGPMKGVPKLFHYEDSSELATSYNQVTIRYAKDASITVNIEIAG